jgi:hypothetical protein
MDADKTELLAEIDEVCTSAPRRANTVPVAKPAPGTTMRV